MAADRKGKGPRRALELRSFGITCHDPEEWNSWYLKTISRGSDLSSFRGILWQPEIGDDGGEHIQAIVQLKHQKTTSALKKLLPPLRLWITGLKNKAHIRNTVSYCSDTAKKRFLLADSDEYRAWPSIDAFKTQGQRTDLHLMMQAAQAGATDQELFDGDLTGNCFARFHRHAHFARSMALRAKGSGTRDVKVYALCGDAGSGKSHSARHDYGDVYCPGHSRGGEPWFTTYEGEETLLLEEMGRDDSISLRSFLTFTDKWELELQTKGGHTFACWTTVVITSNKAPDQWFGQDFYPRELARRLTEVTVWEGEYPDNSVSQWVPPEQPLGLDF